jgi:hypothetical protein
MFAIVRNSLMTIKGRLDAVESDFRCSQILDWTDKFILGQSEAFSIQTEVGPCRPLLRVEHVNYDGTHRMAVTVVCSVTTYWTDVSRHSGHF